MFQQRKATMIISRPLENNQIVMPVRSAPPSNRRESLMFRGKALIFMQLKEIQTFHPATTSLTSSKHRSMQTRASKTTTQSNRLIIWNKNLSKLFTKSSNKRRRLLHSLTLLPGRMKEKSLASSFRTNRLIWNWLPPIRLYRIFNRNRASIFCSSSNMTRNSIKTKKY